MTSERIAAIRARWPEHEASWQDVEDLCVAVEQLSAAVEDGRSCVADLADKLDTAELEVGRMKRHAQAWALYAFKHHGDDSRLYNGLADLGGVTPDGEGWIKPEAS